MPKISEWTEYINALEAYAKKHKEFPTMAEANVVFHLKGLETVDKKRYYTIRQTIINRSNFLKDNPWYKPARGKLDDLRLQAGDPPVIKEYHYPTLEEKRQAIGLDPVPPKRKAEDEPKKDTPEHLTVGPDKIVMHKKCVSQEGLFKALDIVLANSQLWGFELCDIGIKLVRREVQP